MEIKAEALNTLKDFSKSHKDKGMDEFVDAMNKKIISSSVKNAENWWKSLEPKWAISSIKLYNKRPRNQKKRNVKGHPIKCIKKNLIKRNKLSVAKDIA